MTVSCLPMSFSSFPTVPGTEEKHKRNGKQGKTCWCVVSLSGEYLTDHMHLCLLQVCVPCSGVVLQPFGWSDVSGYDHRRPGGH